MTIQNAKFSSVFRILDFVLALIVIGTYSSFLFFIIIMTYKLIISDKDELAKIHYKRKLKNWLFIVEPLVQIKEELKKENTQLEKSENDSQEIKLKDKDSIFEKPKKLNRGKDFLIPYFLFSQILKDFLLAPILVFSVSFVPG